MQVSPWLHRGVAAALVCSAAVLTSVTAIAQTAAVKAAASGPAPGSAQGQWQANSPAQGARQLTYTAKTTLLNQATAFELRFFCDPISTKTEKGTLGLEVTVLGVAALKTFKFDAFEGPDATAHGKKPLRIEIVGGTSALSWQSEVNGWTPDTGRFTFGVAAESQRAKSLERSVLQALADGAQTLQLTVTDPGNAKTQLQFTVPVGAQAAQFKALLAGLK